MTEKEIIIEARLRIDQEFLEKCILLLYEKQTEDEQAVGGTIEENGVGFNTADATFLSGYVQQITSGDEDDRFQAQYHTAGAVKRMLKYVKQLSNYLTDDEIEE